MTRLSPLRTLPPPATPVTETPDAETPAVTEIKYKITAIGVQKEIAGCYIVVDQDGHFMHGLFTMSYQKAVKMAKALCKEHGIPVYRFNGRDITVKDTKPRAPKTPQPATLTLPAPKTPAKKRIPQPIQGAILTKHPSISPEGHIAIGTKFQDKLSRIIFHVTGVDSPGMKKPVVLIQHIENRNGQSITAVDEYHVVSGIRTGKYQVL